MRKNIIWNTEGKIMDIVREMTIEINLVIICWDYDAYTYIYSFLEISYNTISKSLNFGLLHVCLYDCPWKGAKIITHSLDPEPWRIKVKWYWIFRYNYTKVYIINRYANGCITFLLNFSKMYERKMIMLCGVYNLMK